MLLWVTVGWLYACHKLALRFTLTTVWSTWLCFYRKLAFLGVFGKQLVMWCSLVFFLGKVKTLVCWPSVGWMVCGGRHSRTCKREHTRSSSQLAVSGPRRCLAVTALLDLCSSTGALTSFWTSFPENSKMELSICLFAWILCSTHPVCPVRL